MKSKFCLLWLLLEVGAEQFRLSLVDILVCLMNIVSLKVCREECVVGDRVHGTGVDHVWPGCLVARGGVVQVFREREGGAGADADTRRCCV